MDPEVGVVPPSMSNRANVSPGRETPPVKQRAKELSSGSGEGPLATDPPRPAREGHEWVWFPEGYWAEREIRGLPAASRKGSDARLWRWKARSSKSKSSSDDQRASPMSPKTLLHTPPGSGYPVPPSPYKSEEAHVHSLQHPSALRYQHRQPSQDGDFRESSTWREMLTFGIEDVTGSKSTSNGPGKGLLSAARRGLGAAL